METVAPAPAAPAPQRSAAGGAGMLRAEEAPRQEGGHVRPDDDAARGGVSDDGQREVSAAVALLNNAPAAARGRAGSAAPAYLADAILSVASHQVSPPAPTPLAVVASAPSSASSSARSIGSDALKSGGATPPDAPAAAPAAAAVQSEDGEPFVECMPTINQTVVLMINQKDIDAFEDDAGEAGSHMTVQTAKILALKKHCIVEEDVQRITKTLRYAFSRNFSRAEVHQVPREDLQIFVENTNDAFKTGDVQPRVGSKTWHIMRWLLHDEHTRCVLTREKVSKFVGSEIRYALIADASAFERVDAAGAPSANELSGLRARISSLETQLRTKGEAVGALEKAIAAKDERIKRGIAENETMRRELECHKELSMRMQAESERLLGENATLAADRDRHRSALQRAGLGGGGGGGRGGEMFP